MTLDTLSDFISAIEGAGELVRVRQPVAAKLELCEIADRAMKMPNGGAALLFEHVPGHLETVIEGGVLVCALGRFDGARFGLGSAKNQARDTRVDHCAHAHLAGFDRHVQRRTRQPVIPDALCRVADGDDLGVRGGIVRADRLVAARTHDLAIDHDHRTDGNFPARLRLPCGMQGGTHEPGIATHAGSGGAQQSRRDVRLRQGYARQPTHMARQPQLTRSLARVSEGWRALHDSNVRPPGS